MQILCKLKFTKHNIGHQVLKANEQQIWRGGSEIQKTYAYNKAQVSTIVLIKEHDDRKYLSHTNYSINNSHDTNKEWLPNCENSK